MERIDQTPLNLLKEPKLHTQTNLPSPQTLLSLPLLSPSILNHQRMQIITLRPSLFQVTI